MATGLSYASFSAVVKKNIDTLYEWGKVYPEFSEAKKVAFAENLIFWEKVGIDGLHSITEYVDGKPQSSKTLNATIWIFNMKNRHKWRDKQPDESEVIVNNITAVSDEELDAKLARLLGDKK